MESNEGQGVMTLPDLIKIARSIRYRVADPDELHADREKLGDFMTYLLNIESEIDELDLVSEGETPFTMEKRLAIAEAQSLRTAIFEFDRVVSKGPDEDFKHGAFLLRNALARFIILADGIQ